jgi:hypothetical protein
MLRPLTPAGNVKLWKWILLVCLAVLLSGCVSNGYQPGSPGVRDLPQANYFAPSYGFVHNSDGSANSYSSLP